MAETGKDLRDRLSRFGALADEAIPLAEAALVLAAVAAPETDLVPYHGHLTALAAAVRAHHAALLRGAPDSAALRLASLRQVLAAENGYRGDNETYDDLQNASLIRVIDRRRGLPIALAILYIHAAREAGWTAQGINFPGNFLVRLELGSERLIFRPVRRRESAGRS